MHLVIDHGNGEFSVYRHLKEGSLKDAEGEKVRKGQGIAQVGNTGKSGAPHLHFQVMDSADFRTANGLPVMFEDMPASAMLVEQPIRANTLSVSDNVFSTVK
ncbi:MAG: M23 family metallopeptidase [Deltaproteobacteria bacterium]|nr:M23 family metallopeptidase [Deltaproteobacteria bacterium]